jgi:hypothetical protein
MKRYVILLVIGILFAHISYAQNYDNILNYTSNTTPVNGVKIKTNLPFVPANGMPTITIKGYNYGGGESISLTMTYYVWWNPPVASSYYFYDPKISSSGSYTPKIFLSNEGGKVIIFIDDKSYFQRFTVSVYSKDQGEMTSWFQGWTAVDEALSGTNTVEVSYRNRFKGDVFMPGNGLWDSNGNLGIGTTTPKERLSVNGKIRAHEIRVETASWPDYVFAKDYKLPSLQETEKHINENGHLPGIPSAQDVKTNGIDLGEMHAKLLQKIEELTLHVIEQNKQLQLQNRRINELEKTSNK